MALSNLIKQREKVAEQLELQDKRQYIEEGQHILELTDYELVYHIDKKTGKELHGPAFTFEVVESDNPTHPPKTVLHKMFALSNEGYRYVYTKKELEEFFNAICGVTDPAEKQPLVSDDPNQETFVKDLEDPDIIKKALKGRRVLCKGESVVKGDKKYTNYRWYAVAE